jgi:hypothetical protein
MKLLLDFILFLDIVKFIYFWHKDKIGWFFLCVLFIYDGPTYMTNVFLLWMFQIWETRNKMLQECLRIEY